MISEIGKLKTNSKILLVIAFIAVFFIGALTNKTATQKSESSDTANQQEQKTNDSAQQDEVTIDKIKALFNDKNIVLGDKNSKNLIVEISDPSCPFCHAAGGMNPELNRQIGNQFILSSDGGSYKAPVPEIKKLVEEGKAAFVYLYANGHGAGEMAAKAFYCANDQGKFWQVHDLLMSSDGYTLVNNVVKNDKSKTQELVNFLSSAIDSSKLKQCLDSGKYDEKLAEDMKTAVSLGFRGTPDFYINATNFGGAQNWENMKSSLNN